MVNKVEKLKEVKSFNSLIEYLRDELDWPIDVDDVDEITFDYEPQELGIKEEHAVKINSIKQIRPLTDDQPWGLFFIDFEPKKLPVVVMRRILKALIFTRRKSTDRVKSWDLKDMIFISSLGEEEERKITFAHFSESEKGLPELRTFSWDRYDTNLRYLQNTLELDKLRWPQDEQDIETWRTSWSSAFTLKHRYVIRTSQQLAEKMAQLAIQIREQIEEVYQYENPNGPLHELFENFKRVLIRDLNITTFSDMYAQTITYGLFSAKATHEDKFHDEDIDALIPNTNPFLKNLFMECTNIGDDKNMD
jgi:hypothetical protein